MRPIHLLALAAQAMLLAGCGLVARATAVSPSPVALCDEVTITGENLHLGQPTIFFTGAVAREFHWTPVTATTPATLVATVPQGATTGPVRVRIDIDTNVIGAEGSDVTFPPIEIRGSPPPPVINSFDPAPAEVVEGTPVALSWSVGPHTALFLDGVDVTGTTSTERTPRSLHTVYVLTAMNRCISSRARAVVHVIPIPHLDAIGAMPVPGSVVTLTGSGLARAPLGLSAAPTVAVFTQGTARVESTITDPLPSQIRARVPAVFTRGEARVQAKVGTLSSNVVSFMVGGHTNGPFVEVTDQIGESGRMCGTRTLQIIATGTYQLRAVFMENGRQLDAGDFTPGPLSGAAFSPDCRNGIVMSYSAETNTSHLVVKRLGATGRFDLDVRTMAGFGAEPGRFHLLFSPDDGLVMASSIPSAGTNRAVVIALYDLESNTSYGPLMSDCGAAACTSLAGSVEGGSTVRVTLDGAAHLVPIR